MASALDWGPSCGPPLILDQSGDLTQLLNEGAKAEKEFEITGKVPDPACTDDESCKAMLAVIGESLKSDPSRYRKMMDGIAGVTIVSITGADMLVQMEQSGALIFPAIIVSKSSKFADNLTGGPMNLSGATGPPDIDISSTKQIFGLVELWKERNSGKYEKKVYDFPRHLDERVAALNLEKPDHICVQVEDVNQPANDRDGQGKCLKVLKFLGKLLDLILRGAALVLAYVEDCG
ncbi:adenosylhomocysteinase-like [Apium graveolens]|uniref:adenosylhomocysteinase-like n=1 Tax=Apium graveolens TaxID=4045 RepID=UPI003D7BE110